MAAKVPNSTNSAKTPVSSISSISSNGLETHKVETEDGYILGLFRLVGDKNEKEKVGESQKIPVLFIPGFFNDGMEWLLLEDEEKTLPHILAKQGYDCWMGTLRGTPHSRDHTTLKTNSKKFWDFCLDEQSTFDLPALIDYVLKATGAKSLFYIGFSMGGYIVLPMLCLKPEYSSKIRAIVGLSPGVYAFDFKKNPMFRFGIPIVGSLPRCGFLLKRPICGTSFTKGVKKLVPSFTKINRENLAGSCLKLAGKVMGPVIAGVVSDREGLNRLAEHMPSGSSLKLLVHLCQNFKSRELRMFDYGRNGNIKRYGVIKPPQFDLGQISVPVATFSSDYDRLIPPAGVLRASEELPNLISHTHITTPNFTHCDFLIGSEVHILVYPKIVDILQQYSSTPPTSTINIDPVDIYSTQI